MSPPHFASQTSENFVQCPHIVWKSDQISQIRMCGVPTQNSQTSYQFSCQSSPTCIFECGTPCTPLSHWNKQIFTKQNREHFFCKSGLGLGYFWKLELRLSTSPPVYEQWPAFLSHIFSCDSSSRSPPVRPYIHPSVRPSVHTSGPSVCTYQI